jgi:rubrerythrin
MAPDDRTVMRPSSIDDVLAFAMNREVSAVQRYLILAERVADPVVAQLLDAIADQERTHHARLEAISAGDLTAFNLNLASAVPVSEAAPVAEPGRDASVAQVLLFAINAEHEAVQLYMRLASAATDPGLATLFRTLAAEEQGHHARLDQLYRKVAIGDG